MGKIAIFEIVLLLAFVLAPVAAIVIGLLIFFKGRAHVRRKHGTK